MKEYAPLQQLEQKRLAARRHKTTYCYDFPSVFGNALREVWAARAAAGEPDAVPPLGETFPLPLCFLLQSYRREGLYKSLSILQDYRCTTNGSRVCDMV